MARTPPKILILAPVNQFLGRASCRGGREGVGKREHNRIAHSILDQVVELFLGIHDLVSIVAVDNISRTVTLVEMTPQGADLVMASVELKFVYSTDGLHAETARPKGREHFPKIQLIEDRGLTTCIQPDHQALHLGLASLITRVPEQDDLIAITHGKFTPACVHTACSVRALLVNAHRFTETLEHKGARSLATSSSPSLSRPP